MRRKIVVPIDLSQENAFSLAVPHAVDAARLHDATLHVLTVLEDISAVGGEFHPYATGDQALAFQHLDKLRVNAEKALSGTCQKYIPEDIDWESDIVMGHLPRTLIETIDSLKPYMVVMASHDPSWTNRLFGSVADQVVRHISSSILIIRDEELLGAGRTRKF